MPRITEKQLDKAISSKDPSTLPVCCIIKSTVTNLVDGTAKTAWQIVTEPKESCCLEIDRKKALAVITLLDLEPVIEDKGDVLYDTSDSAYRKRYRFHDVTC